MVGKLAKQLGGLKGKDMEQVKKALDIIVEKTENITEAVIHTVEVIERINPKGDKGTTYCQTCRNKFKKDSLGNVTRTFSDKPAGDTTTAHDKPRKNK